MPAESVVDRLGRLVFESTRMGIPPGPLALRRAWPSGPAHLLLEYETADGELLAGQWFADGTTLDQVARETSSVARADVVVATLGDTRILLQARGADRCLPGLRPLVLRPAATLVSHRPERRALVRLDGQRYAKVVPPERLPAVLGVVEKAARLAGPAFDVPTIVEIDEAAGVMEMDALHGLSLHELLEGDDERTAAASRAVGRAVAALHAAAPPETERRHGPLEEAAVVREWLESTAAHAPQTAAAIEAEAQAVLGGLGRLPGVAASPVHRDLHDKQCLLTAGGRVALLDFDTLARGDAAVDLANLLVHLELRWLEGQCSEASARHAAEALLEGYSPAPATSDRLDPYADATRIRLACVYAFRPRWGDVPTRLLSRVGLAPIQGG